MSVSILLDEGFVLGKCPFMGPGYLSTETYDYPGFDGVVGPRTAHRFFIREDVDDYAYNVYDGALNEWSRARNEDQVISIIKTFKQIKVLYDSINYK